MDTVWILVPITYTEIKFEGDSQCEHVDNFQQGKPISLFIWASIYRLGIKFK